MFTITTTLTTNDSGRSRILAKGHGRQRTYAVDRGMSPEQNSGAAAGTLLNVLLDDNQKRAILLPSGDQRIRVQRVRRNDPSSPVVWRWTINV